MQTFVLRRHKAVGAAVSPGDCLQGLLACAVTKSHGINSHSFFGVVLLEVFLKENNLRVDLGLSWKGFLEGENILQNVKFLRGGKRDTNYPRKPKQLIFGNIFPFVRFLFVILYCISGIS